MNQKVMKLIIILVGMIIFLNTSVMGADYHWTGAAGDNKWSTPGNWLTSTGASVSFVDTANPHTYNFTQSGFFDKSVCNLTVTQDVDVAFGSAVAVKGSGYAKEELSVTFYSAEGKKATTPTDSYISLHVQENARLILALDLSNDESGMKIQKHDDGILVFDLKSSNSASRELVIFDGACSVAETSKPPRIRVIMQSSITASRPATFNNFLPGATYSALSVIDMSKSNFRSGRVNLNGFDMNIGDSLFGSTATNYMPLSIFADGATLTVQDERRMYLEGLPFNGTLALDRADVHVATPRTAIRWLFDDTSDPLKDVVGFGSRLLAPNGIPEVIDDEERGKVLYFDGVKYLKGPDGADAGFTELQLQSTNNPYTVAFWIKPDSDCDPKAKIFYWGGNSENNKAAALRLNNESNKPIMFTIWGNNQTPTIQGVTSIKNGSWHHIAVAYDGIERIRIYHNGQQVLVFTCKGYYPPNKNFYIGSIYGGWVNNGLNPYKGKMDDFLIVSTELSADKIASLYNNGLKNTIGVGSVETKSAGTVSFLEERVNVGKLSGNALVGGVKMLSGGVLSVGTESGAVSSSSVFKGKIEGDGVALKKLGENYALELQGQSHSLTNLDIKEGVLSLRRPLARAGLVAYWSFDDASDFGVDSSPSGLYLEKNGNGPQFEKVEDGVSGSAIKFKGNAYLHSRTFFRPSVFPLGADPYTVSVWVRPTAEACQNTVSICSWGKNDGNQVSLIRFNSATGVNYTTWGATKDSVAEGVNLTDGYWHHIVATYDGSTKCLYVDGVLKDTDDCALNIGRDLPVQIGHWTNSSHNDKYYTGDMDEFQIIRGAWSAGEVAAEYARKAPNTVAVNTLLPSPVCHWTFDDAENIGKDSSSNNITLSKNGDITLEEGEYICGKAARFSSESGLFKLESFPNVIPASSNAFSVVVRYRADKTQISNGRPSVIAWGTSGSGLFKLGTGNNDSKTVRFTGAMTVEPSGFYRTNMGTENSRWVTLAFVYSPVENGLNNVFRLFADGEQIYANVINNNEGNKFDIKGQDFVIGANKDGGDKFRGLIDDIQIYDCSLSAGQVRIIAEKLEASKGLPTMVQDEITVLDSAAEVIVAEGATMKVAANEAFAALSGSGAVEVSPLASLTVENMRGFSGTLTGYGRLVVLKGSSLNKNIVTIADTLKVSARFGTSIILR